MAKELVFLDFDGLDDHQEEELLMYIYPSVKNPLVELPWEEELFEEETISTGNVFSLNVHAPSFQSKNLNLYDYHKGDTVDPVCHKSNPLKVEMTPIKTSGDDSSAMDSNFSQLNEKNISDVYRKETESVCDMPDANGNSIDEPCVPQSAVLNHTTASSTVSNGTVVNQLTSSSVVLSSMSVHPRAPFPHNSRTSAGFKMCPTVSSFVPQNIPGFASNQPSTGLNNSKLVDAKSNFDSTEKNVDNNLVAECDCVLNSDQKRDGSPVCASIAIDNIEESPNSSEVDLPDAVKEEKNQSNHVPQTVMPRSFADVLKSKFDEKTYKISAIGKIHADKKNQSLHNENCSLCNMKNDAIEDKSAHTLGKHFYDLQLDFSPVLLQPRGLINCRNWCYVNATLQALLACPPFYRLLRSLPKVPLVNRGRSSTPVIDSMVSLAHEFVIIPKSQEDLNPGTPIQPNTVYEMLGALKSDCLKGQQEDAEEFLSYILNGMHEEMVLLIKNFEKKNNLLKDDGAKVNGHFETNEDDEWQVIGAKQRGMITRKVIEHKTPISDLLGGQIKSFLTTNGKASASASVQPFFTLPLDIQAENVNSVEEALNQMTVKEPVQGYTCAKTKQEVEAFSKILLQKLPPILILHLKRFVYNKKGGCKKVMKHTEYPISLELKKDLFSPEAKKAKKPSTYKLFAVMYHNGEDATTGHYISDIYHHGSNNWIRCDDRNVTSITEIQVLSHSPPRVPYLLFYQVNDPTNESSA